MLLDDDYPDYFTDDDDTEAGTDPRLRDENTDSQTQHVIHFSDADTSRGSGSGSRPDNDEYDDADDFRHSGRTWIAVAIVIAAVLVLTAYFRYFSPCVDDAVTDARIESVQTRGTLFKTHEARITDVATGRQTDVSVADAATAEAMQQAQGSSRVMRLHYRRYHASLPWRGESEVMVFSAR